MRSDDPRIGRLELDGQTLLLPSAEAWAVITEAGELDGRPVAVGRLLEQYLRFAAVVPELEVALGEVREPGKPWWVYHVVQVGDRRYRVKPERQSCSCGWSGTTGLHREYAIYIGTADPLEALEAHWDVALASCPRCGGGLLKPAVWARAVDDDHEERDDEQ